VVLAERDSQQRRKKIKRLLELKEHANVLFPDLYQRLKQYRHHPYADADPDWSLTKSKYFITVALVDRLYIASSDDVASLVEQSWYMMRREMFSQLQLDGCVESVLRFHADNAANWPQVSADAMNLSFKATAKDLTLRRPKPSRDVQSMLSITQDASSVK